MSREELALRAEAFAGFERWCHDNGARSDVVFTGEPDEADIALVGYERHLFRQGATIGKAKRVLFYARKQRSALRHALPTSWDVVTQWELDEPGDSRVPLPRAGYGAEVALCCIWSSDERDGAIWKEMLRAQVLGWVALARPTDLCETAAVAFVVFELPKGRWSRRAPKEEHVRVEGRVGAQRRGQRPRGPVATLGPLVEPAAQRLLRDVAEAPARRPQVDDLRARKSAGDDRPHLLHVRRRAEEEERLAAQRVEDGVAGVALQVQQKTGESRRDLTEARAGGARPPLDVDAQDPLRREGRSRRASARRPPPGSPASGPRGAR